MQNQRNNTPNKPVTLQLIARKGSDGCIELIADVFGAYTARDRLRSDQFQFVKNCSAGMGTAAPLDKNGNRKVAPVWRKLLIAAEEKSYATDGVNLISEAVSQINALLGDALKGAKVRGAKAAAMALASFAKEGNDIKEAVDKLAALDTPWQVTAPVASQKVA